MVTFFLSYTEKKLYLFTVNSIASMIAAHFVCAVLVGSNGLEGRSRLFSNASFTLAGAVGAFGLFAASNKLIAKIKVGYRNTIILIGAVSGCFFGLLLMTQNASLIYNPYLIWQVLVGVTLGYCIDRSVVVSQKPNESSLTKQ